MAKVTLTWEARPANENVKYYKVYEVLPTGRFLVGTTETNTLVLHEVPQGSHTWLVAGVSTAVGTQTAGGEGIVTSPLTVLVFPPFGTPGIPANFRADVAFNPGERLRAYRIATLCRDTCRDKT